MTNVTITFDDGAGCSDTKARRLGRQLVEKIYGGDGGDVEATFGNLAFLNELRIAQQEGYISELVVIGPKTEAEMATPNDTTFVVTFVGGRADFWPEVLSVWDSQLDALLN